MGAAHEFIAAHAYEVLWRHAGRRDQRALWRRRSFLAGIAVAAVALLTPIDALSGSLSSAHMVQHLLLTTVVAPVLVLGAPLRSLLTGTPPPLRGRFRRLRMFPAVRQGSALLAHPVAASLPYVAVLWWWHARAPYVD